jgi:formylglycine-generating enzyme required for sulfatase activity
MIRITGVQFLLALTACSSAGSGGDSDVLEVEGLIFRRISPAKVGGPEADFFLLETEVTNAMYARYLAETGLRKTEEDFELSPERKKLRAEGWQSSAEPLFRVTNPTLLWKNNRPPAGTEEHPVALVTLMEAVAYGEWLTRRHPGLGVFRVPTADEWKTAAYGAGRACPWGDGLEASRACVDGRSPEPVRQRPEGRSPEGVYGLWGNVSEYVLPPNKYQTPLPLGFGVGWVGGGFNGPLPKPRQQYWGFQESGEVRTQDIGFRVLLDPGDAGRR